MCQDLFALGEKYICTLDIHRNEEKNVIQVNHLLLIFLYYL